MKDVNTFEDFRACTKPTAVTSEEIDAEVRDLMALLFPELETIDCA